MEKAKHAAHIGQRQPITLFGGVIRALLFSLLTALFLLLVFAYILYRFPEKGALLTPLAFITAALVALLGGFYGGRTLQRNGALCGISTGVCLVFLFALVALILRAGTLSSTAIPLYLLIMAAATAGGIRGAKKSKKRRRH